MTGVHAEFVASLNPRQFQTGADRVRNVMEGTSRSVVQRFREIDNAAKSTAAQIARTGGARGGRGPGGVGMAGGIGLQVQDVAVQLQSGAKATTVIAQQGSQIASLFGPAGAILGGVIAIGAAMWGVAGATKAAKKEANDLAEGAKVNERIRDNEDLADVLEAQVKHGEDFADQRERDIKFEREIARINADPTTSEAQKIAARAAAERVRAAQDTLAIQRQQVEANKEEVAAMQEFRKTRREIEQMSLSSGEKLMRLTKEVAEAWQRIQKSTGDAVQDAKNLADWSAKDKALHEAGMEANREGMQAAEKSAREMRDGIQSSVKSMGSIWDAIKEKTTDVRDKTKELVDLNKQLTTEKQKQKDIDSGSKILARAKEIRTPAQERAEARKEARDQKNAERRAISEEIDRADTANRKAGGSGLTKAQKDAMRRELARRAGMAKPEAIKAEVSQSSIEKLTAAIEKLLAK